VYYIEKFEQDNEMDVCGTCAEYVRDHHTLSDEEYNEVTEFARAQ